MHEEMNAEDQRLRNALEQIRLFSDIWAGRCDQGCAVESWSRGNLTTISAIADAALSEKTSAVDAVTLDVIGEVK